MTLRQFVTKTDPGRRRRNNEDVFVCEPPLFAIADGMGGAQAGEVASGLAAEALKEGEDGKGTSEERVNALIQSANRRVYEKAQQDMALAGMGTTLTLALVDEGTVTFGHVGDSRAYRLRDGKLEQITDDHSLVAELTRAGKLSEEEAETHPQRSVITRALGTDPDVDGDVFQIETEEGDVFLLCSDGLSDMVGDGTIEETLQRHRANLKKAAQELVKAANKGGGEDNITVLLFEVGAAADRTEEAVPVEQDDDEDTLSELDGVPVIAAKPDEWSSQDGDVPEPVVDHPPTAQEPGAGSTGSSRSPSSSRSSASGLFGLSQSHFVGRREGRPRRRLPGPSRTTSPGSILYRRVYVEPCAGRAADPARTATSVRP